MVTLRRELRICEPHWSKVSTSCVRCVDGFRDYVSQTTSLMFRGAMARYRLDRLFCHPQILFPRRVNKVPKRGIVLSTTAERSICILRRRNRISQNRRRKDAKAVFDHHTSVSDGRFGGLGANRHKLVIRQADAVAGADRSPAAACRSGTVGEEPEQPEHSRQPRGRRARQEDQEHLPRLLEHDRLKGFFLTRWTVGGIMFKRLSGAG